MSFFFDCCGSREPLCNVCCLCLIINVWGALEFHQFPPRFDLMVMDDPATWIQFTFIWLHLHYKVHDMDAIMTFQFNARGKDYTTTRHDSIIMVNVIMICVLDSIYKYTLYIRVDMCYISLCMLIVPLIELCLYHGLNRGCTIDCTMFCTSYVSPTVPVPLLTKSCFVYNFC